MPQVWQLMQHHLHFLSHAFHFEIFSFVLMANHFHLIVRAPEGNLSEGMSHFLRETSREMVRSSNRINQTYGGRFFRSSLNNYHYYLHCYKYVYRNPVNAGLAARVEDYPWSTLRGLLGLEKMIISLVEDETFFNDTEEVLHWLNQVPSKENWLAVQKALRKREFQLSYDRNTREPHHLEKDLF